MITQPSTDTTVVVITGASLAGLAAYLYLNRKPSTPALNQSPPRFTQQDLTARFTASIPEITSELNLELATCKQVETFTQSDGCTVLWGLLDLGTNVAQVSVPVTYRYHLQLRDVWRLEPRGQMVRVVAPTFQAALPPAIHTDELQRLSVRGWGRFAPTDLVQQLEQQITPKLAALADDPRRRQLVRDTCRKSVAEFVRLWLEREGQWGRSGFNQIQVQFADEAALPSVPTLKLS